MLQFGETGNCNLVETSYHLSLKKKSTTKTRLTLSTVYVDIFTMYNYYFRVIHVP